MFLFCSNLLCIISTLALKEWTFTACSSVWSWENPEQKFLLSCILHHKIFCTETILHHGWIGVTIFKYPGRGFEQCPPAGQGRWAVGYDWKDYWCYWELAVSRPHQAGSKCPPHTSQQCQLWESFLLMCAKSGQISGDQCLLQHWKPSAQWRWICRIAKHLVMRGPTQEKKQKQQKKPQWNLMLKNNSI